MLGTKPVTVLLGLIAIFAILGLIFVGMSQQLPSQEQQRQNQEQPQNQHAAADQKIPEKQNNQANGWTKIKKAIERNEKMLTAISTAVIAAFTIALAFATAFLYFSSEKVADAAKTSADAAKQSADAIASIERPYIFVVAKPVEVAKKDGPDTIQPKISFTVTNFGRVPAIIRLVYTHCSLIETLPPTPTVSLARFKQAQSAIAAGTAYTTFPICEFEKPFTAEDWTDLRSGKKSAVFVGVFLYEGALDFTYASAAAYKIDLFTGEAFAVGGNAYNYDTGERGRITKGVAIPVPHVVP